MPSIAQYKNAQYSGVEKQTCNHFVTKTSHQVIRYFKLAAKDTELL